MTSYVMRTSNGVLYPYDTHSHLLEQDPSKYKLYQEGVSDPATMSEEDRKNAVIKAVFSVPVEDYTKQGKPPVAMVSELAGFKVSSDEVEAAMEQTK